MAGILPNFLRNRRHENGSVAQVLRVCNTRGTQDRRGNCQYLQADAPGRDEGKRGSHWLDHNSWKITRTLFVVVAEFALLETVTRVGDPEAFFDLAQVLALV